MRQGVQDDVVKVKVGRSVQSVYAEDANALEGGERQQSNTEGGVADDVSRQVCSGEEGSANGGECSAGSDEAEEEAYDPAEHGIDDVYYYDAYFNASGVAGPDDMEYYDDYLFLGSEEL